MNSNENYVIRQIAGRTVAIFTDKDTADLRRAVSLKGEAYTDTAIAEKLLVKDLPIEDSRIIEKEAALKMEDFIPVITSFFDEGKNVIITGVGNSMMPLIRHKKDGIVLSAYKNQALKVGDMVFYRREDNRYVLHRITQISDDGSITTLGDNQLSVENGISYGQVIALATAIIRGKKRVEVTSKGYGLYLKLWTKSMFLRKIYIGLAHLKTRLYGLIKR